MFVLRKPFVLCLAAALAATAAPPVSPVVERIGNTVFLQLEADSFNSLPPKQQALAYWLNQASIAINPIIFDQLSRFGLREKALLETLVAAKSKIDPAIYAKILNYTKLFWGNRGNHTENTSQKFLPEFTAAELTQALTQAGRKDLIPEAEALAKPLFDPEFEPLITSKSPPAGMDILQASANNFYSGVKLDDLKNFTERYRLNSRLTRENGKLKEEVYRTNPPGLYSVYLTKANTFLEKAKAYAEPDQAKVISDLIRYYQTGEYKDWLQFDIDWVANNPPVDFMNGFIEVYRDARGAKASSQSFVSITDQKLSDAMKKIADNAQYFEDRAPWDARYKKQGVKPPSAKAVETTIETGDFHITTIGDNLPNENEIREKYGTKSFLLSGNSRALDAASGPASLNEFGASPEDIARDTKYGPRAGDLMTAMHEVIGHGSGKLSPKLTNDAAFYLKEYASALEEGRADLMALWNVFDPKMKELGLVETDDIGRAMYDSAARTMLTQLRRISKGETIEEDHARDRQMIARYIMDKTGAIVQEERNGKTYVYVKDYKKMREGVGMLLAELMRIKAEGDYAAIKALMDKYGVRFDPKLRDQVMARYKALNLPTYFVGINPDLNATLDAKGDVTKATITYPRDYVQQQMTYSAIFAK